MENNITKSFEEYKQWYQEHYVPEVLIGGASEDLEDVKKQDWDDPYRHLVKVEEAGQDKLPENYKSLISKFGAGKILVAFEEEPVNYYLIPPSEFEQYQKAFFTWLKDSQREAAKLKGIDLDKTFPIMCLGPKTASDFALLVLAGDQEGSVYLWGHEEPGVFKGPKSLDEFFQIFFDRAKLLKPLNTFEKF